MSVMIRPGPDSLEPAAPHALFPLPTVYYTQYSYDVAPGGQRFLVVAPSSDRGREPLSVVVNEVAPWCADQVEQVASICRSYVNRKRLLGLVDFDDLLLYWRAAAADELPGSRQQ